jgi:hypothetical protein
MDRDKDDELPSVRPNWPDQAELNSTQVQPGQVIGSPEASHVARPAPSSVELHRFLCL